MKKHSLDKLMNRLSLALLLGTAAFLIVYWRRIPEEVPMHFNAAGEIDRWSPKSGLIILPVITWMLYGLLTVVEKIFGTWNTGVKCARENWAQIYILLGHLISTQKLLFMAMFAGIILCCALTLPLPVWFTPVMPGLVFLDMAYWIVQLIRAK